MSGTKDTAHVPAMPWMISPSVPDLYICTRENGDTVVTADVATLPADGDPAGELDTRRVEIVFRSGQWLRTHPAASDHEVIPPDRFDWSGVPFSKLPPGSLATFLEEFRSEWIRTQACPDPRLYEIDPSSWLRETGAAKYGCRHYVIRGHDIWMEVLSIGFSWRWCAPGESIALDTSPMDPVG